MRKVLPTFLVAFFSASSVAALSLAMETCGKKLGIKKNMVSFVYPLGAVVYMNLSGYCQSVMVFDCDSNDYINDHCLTAASRS